MSFKKICTLCALLVSLYCVLFALNSSPEIVDRIVAVVNEQVITLTDLQIMQTFGLFEQELEGKNENPLLSVLDKMVDQKVVIDATKEKIPVEDNELDEALRKIKEKFSSEEFQTRLDKFGLSIDDLKTYLKEKILYQKILSRRFGKGGSLNLEEIETYYQEIYVPSQEKYGLRPKPMLEILDEIELTVKKEKIRLQIEDWISNLREQVDVELKLETVMQTKKSET